MIIKYSPTMTMGTLELQYIDYFWDESTSEWVVDYKAEHTYDDNGNMTQFLDYYWDRKHQPMGC
ncbi:MAG: hypothetical protein R2771_10050 [Saprospiraceae bacterium]